MFKTLIALIAFLFAQSAWSLTGYMQNGVCHQTYDAAMSVRFNGYQLVPSGTPNTLAWIQKTTTGWAFVEYNRTTMVLVRSLALPAMTFPACEYTITEQAAIDELTGITSAEVLQVFGFGFGAIVLFWSFGYTIGVGINLIKRI